MKQALKKHESGWSATRLESRVTHGVPDVLLLDHLGRWHLVELKTTERNKVDISPHQVAFASKHARGSCWIAVKIKNRGVHPKYSCMTVLKPWISNGWVRLPNPNSKSGHPSIGRCSFTRLQIGNLSHTLPIPYH